MKISKPAIKSTYEDVLADDKGLRYKSLHKLASDIKEGLTILPDTPLDRRFYANSEYKLDTSCSEIKRNQKNDIRLFAYPEDSEDEKENKINFNNIPNFDEYTGYI